ncbi:unnamed protein product [Musa hybrid cultivar]
MRRQAPEFRRPARRRLPGWMWSLLGISFVVGVVLFFFQHRQDQHAAPVQEKGLTNEEVMHTSLNLTQELLSSSSFARQLADQMTLAKAYVVIAKEHNNLQFAWELSSQIKNCRWLLSQAAVRGKNITEEEAHPIINQLAQLIFKAQDFHYDVSTTISTLKSHALALEERANSAIVQSVQFGQLAMEAMSKSLHCLSMKLTEEWFRNPALERFSDEMRNSPRLVDNNLYHFCIFSDNVLATSVVINSTVSSADHPQQLVFHVVTDEVNSWAMTTWFLMNDFRGCTVEIRSIKEFSWLNASYSPLIRQLFQDSLKDQSGEMNFEDLRFESRLNHLRIYIPQILPLLEKVLFLDDDIVVQKDLTPLYTVELHGNVMGAVETCLEQ